jgi:hypothetical protein
MRLPFHWKIPNIHAATGSEVRVPRPRLVHASTSPPPSPAPAPCFSNDLAECRCRNSSGGGWPGKRACKSVATIQTYWPH